MPYHAAVRRLTWALVALFTSSILMTMGSVYYTNRTQEQWCDLLTTLDRAYQSTPPQTPTGQEVASQVHILTGRVSCK